MNVGWDQNEEKMGLMKDEWGSMKGEWDKIRKRMGLR